MKLILDDVRNFDQDNGYLIFRSYDSFISMLKALDVGDVSFVSLDYDLGKDYHTGYDVLVYMLESSINVNHINIHSDHSVGVPKMKKFIEDNFPKNITVTYNQI